MNAIKEYCKDYSKLQKASNEFYKHHWKGTVLLNVGVLGVTFAGLAVVVAGSNLVNKIRDKKNDNNQEEIES